jgi:hypothetical protein
MYIYITVLHVMAYVHLYNCTFRNDLFTLYNGTLQNELCIFI